MSDMSSMFPGRSQRSDAYAVGVHGENVSATHDQRQRQAKRDSAAYRLAVARHWDITEVAFSDVEQIGSGGRRWSVAGVEYRLSEEHFAEEQDPREVAGVELFFVDGAGQVVYLRRAFGERGLTRPLSDGATGGRVAGNLLITDTGARPIGSPK